MKPQRLVELRTLRMVTENILLHAWHATISSSLAHRRVWVLFVTIYTHNERHSAIHTDYHQHAPCHAETAVFTMWLNLRSSSVCSVEKRASVCQHIWWHIYLNLMLPVWWEMANDCLEDKQVVAWWHHKDIGKRMTKEHLENRYGERNGGSRKKTRMTSSKWSHREMCSSLSSPWWWHTVTWRLWFSLPSSRRAAWVSSTLRRSSLARSLSLSHSVSLARHLHRVIMTTGYINISDKHTAEICQSFINIHCGLAVIILGHFKQLLIQCIIIVLC